MVEEPRNRQERRLLRWSEVHERIPKSRTQVWRDVREGKFPAPVKIGPNAIAWYEDEIDAHQANLKRVAYATA